MLLYPIGAGAMQRGRAGNLSKPPTVSALGGFGKKRSWPAVPAESEQVMSTPNELEKAFTALMAALSPADRSTVTTDIRQRAAQRRREAILQHIESPEALERRRQMSDFIERSR